jgi:hypothetical protein
MKVILILRKSQLSLNIFLTIKVLLSPAYKALSHTFQHNIPKNKEVEKKILHVASQILILTSSDSREILLLPMSGPCFSTILSWRYSRKTDVHECTRQENWCP